MNATGIVSLIGAIALGVAGTTNNTHQRSQGNLIQVCGFRSASEQRDFENVVNLNRIVGGDFAARGEFKWQVAIRSKSKRSSHICGGAVIGRSWVLTAAHCTLDYSPTRVKVVAGEYSISQNDGTEQTRFADLYIKHENYDVVSQANDIALVRLTQPFNFATLNVAPVCLPSPFAEYSGLCVVTGWGKDRENGGHSDVLRKAWLPLISDASCKRKLSTISAQNNLLPEMVCAGHDEGGKDACQGDSGGPLVCPGENNLPILVGIVSWGIGCGRKNIPGIYSQVSHYVRWIHDKIARNSLPPSLNIPFRNQGTLLGNLENSTTPSVFEPGSKRFQEAAPGSINLQSWSISSSEEKNSYESSSMEFEASEEI